MLQLTFNPGLTLSNNLAQNFTNVNTAFQATKKHRLRLLLRDFKLKLNLL